MPVKINLRLNLSDVIASDIESDILDYLIEIKKLMKFTPILWYYKDDLSKKEYDGFIERNKKKMILLEPEYIIMDGKKHFTWFDIISKNDNNELLDHHFKYSYENKNDIFLGLIEFKKIMISKYNKGYKNENRNYRISKVGKQNSH